MDKDDLLSIQALRHPNVIIVGSGRCGTSSIARVCHEELGIYMGKYLKPSDALNPEGYYEDMISHALIRTMVAGDNDAYNPQVYLQIMNNINKDHLIWGVKDPWILYLSSVYLKLLQPKLCVVATRDLKSTVESWAKVWRGKNNIPPSSPVPPDVIKYYKELTIARQELVDGLQKVWPNLITIDFSTNVPDEEIKTAIRYGLSSASFLK